MNLRYNLIVLDFHGTMTENILRTIKSYHEAAIKLWGASPFDKEYYQRVLTRPAQSSGSGITHKEWLQKQFKWKNKREFEQFIELFREDMNSIYMPVPGMRKTCTDLTSMGVELAILTDGMDIKEIETQLNNWRLGYLFPRLYSYHKTGIKKPNPNTIGFILFYRTLKNRELMSQKTIH